MPAVPDESTPIVPLYVYIVAGAVGCVLVGLLMLIFTVKFCKKYRMKKELQRVFNVRVNSYHLWFTYLRLNHCDNCFRFHPSYVPVQFETLPPLVRLFSFHLPGERWLSEPYVQSRQKWQPADQ